MNSEMSLYETQIQEHKKDIDKLNKEMIELKRVYFEHRKSQPTRTASQSGLFNRSNISNSNSHEKLKSLSPLSPLLKLPEIKDKTVDEEEQYKEATPKINDANS